MSVVWRKCKVFEWNDAVSELRCQRRAIEVTQCGEFLVNVTGCIERGERLRIRTKWNDCVREYRVRGKRNWDTIGRRRVEASRIEYEESLRSQDSYNLSVLLLFCFYYFISRTCIAKLYSPIISYKSIPTCTSIRVSIYVCIYVCRWMKLIEST